MRRLPRELSAGGLLLLAGAALLLAAALFVAWLLIYGGAAFDRGEPIPLFAFVLAIVAVGCGSGGVWLAEQALELRRRSRCPRCNASVLARDLEAHCLDVHGASVSDISLGTPRAYGVGTHGPPVCPYCGNTLKSTEGVVQHVKAVHADELP